MGRLTKIGWTNHTFNLVWGCTEVADDPACDNCYAREFATSRFKLPIWGQDADRRVFGADHWHAPLDWHADALRDGVPHFVFCSSMADVFEDHPIVREERKKLWPLIEKTRALVWLLLTKRIDLVLAEVPPAWLLPGGWPPNVWVGTTIAVQDFVKPRVEALAKVPSPYRFVSIEPMLSGIDLRPYLSPRFQKTDSIGTCSRCGYNGPGPAHRCAAAPVEWVICGGESQKKARKMELEWALDLKGQCIEVGVPFFFKQTGVVLARELGLKHRNGEDLSELPEELRIHQRPDPGIVVDSGLGSKQLRLDIG